MLICRTPHKESPAYGRLIELTKFNKPTAAFTGTATCDTQQQIIEKLGFSQPDGYQAIYHLL